MADQPKTLLEMTGQAQEPPALADACLVVIDLQAEYDTGALPLAGIGAAVDRAADAIAVARASGAPVVHVLHETAAGAPIFDPGSPGFQPIAAVAPLEGEAVVRKRLPNAFAGTELESVIRGTGRDQVVLVGAMTHMCVSATARAGLDIGFRMTVVADACATRDLPAIDGGVVPAAVVHRTALAELADAFAIVVAQVEDLNGAR